MERIVEEVREKKRAEEERIYNVIVAIDNDNGIGKNGTMPWRVPEDVAWFKKITTGHTVIMGRKTWESIPKKFRPLPDCNNIVLDEEATRKGVQLVFLVPTIAMLRFRSITI